MPNEGDILRSNHIEINDDQELDPRLKVEDKANMLDIGGIPLLRRSGVVPPTESEKADKEMKMSSWETQMEIESNAKIGVNELGNEEISNQLRNILFPYFSDLYSIALEDFKHRKLNSIFKLLHANQFSPVYKGLLNIDGNNIPYEYKLTYKGQRETRLVKEKEEEKEKYYVRRSNENVQLQTYEQTTRDRNRKSNLTFNFDGTRISRIALNDPMLHEWCLSLPVGHVLQKEALKCQLAGNRFMGFTLDELGEFNNSTPKIDGPRFKLNVKGGQSEDFPAVLNKELFDALLEVAKASYMPLEYGKIDESLINQNLSDNDLTKLFPLRKFSKYLIAGKKIPENLIVPKEEPVEVIPEEPEIDEVNVRQPIKLVETKSEEETDSPKSLRDQMIEKLKATRFLLNPRDLYDRHIYFSGYKENDPLVPVPVISVNGYTDSLYLSGYERNSIGAFVISKEEEASIKSGVVPTIRMGSGLLRISNVSINRVGSQTSGEIFISQELANGKIKEFFEDIGSTGFVVGREVENGIKFDNQEVSAEHVYIKSQVIVNTLTGEDDVYIFVADLNSRNGTKLEYMRMYNKNIDLI